MPLVVLLRGVNVGGHRRFRPSELARQLDHLDVVSIGAAGTFVVRRPVAQSELRAELARRMPFEAEVMICQGRDIVRLASTNPYAGLRLAPDVVRFVSVLAGRPRLTPALPLALPPSGPWLLKVLARDGRFVAGVHRRQMKAIGYLGALDRIFGVKATTRSWSTIEALARVLGEKGVAGNVRHSAS